MAEEKFDVSLELLRRLDPKAVTQNLGAICTLVREHNGTGGEELAQDLLSAVDTPLKVAQCGKTKKLFLCCDYNRDGDLFRSPFSNEYFPPTGDEESPYPSAFLRQLEIKVNESFDIYRDLYYEGGGVSSAYLWDTAEDEAANSLEEGFAGVVLFKKETDDKAGKWDSIHVFEIIAESSTMATYKVTTSVILDLQNRTAGQDSLSLSGTMTRQMETTQSLAVDGGSLEVSHLVNLGQLVEKAEYNIRNLLQEVYFDKLKDIILKDLRSVGDIGEKRADESRHSDLIRGLRGL